MGDVRETIKCACPRCGAKYRLPIEAQGRTARCKRCGEKFQVPRQQSLEDSILTWLTIPDEAEEEAPPPPRVISMPGSENGKEGSMAGRKVRGAIRLKSDQPNTAKEQSA